MKDLTREELAEWAASPTTRKAKRYLQERIDAICREMGVLEKTLDSANADWTHAATARQIGKIGGIQEVIDLMQGEIE